MRKAKLQIQYHIVSSFTTKNKPPCLYLYNNRLFMKKIALSLMMLIVGFSTQAQSIDIFDNKGNSIIGDTIVFDEKFCNDPFEVYEKKGFANVVNKSSSQMVIGLRRYEISAVNGTGDAVCWGATCFGEKPAGAELVWDVNDSAIVAENDTASGLAGFVSYHYPNGNTGDNLYRYEFYAKGSFGVSASIYVRYTVGNKSDAIAIKNNGKESIVGDTIIVEKEVDPFDDFQFFEVKGLATIINEKCTETTIGLRRIERGVVSGTGDAVCWGETCFGQKKAGSEPNWDVADSAIVSPKEEAAGLAGFVVYHYPNKQIGESLYEYQFYDRELLTGIQSSVFVKLITKMQPSKIHFANDETSNAEGDTLKYLVDVDGTNTQEYVLDDPFYVVNYSMEDLNIGVSRTEISTINGIEDVFCWADSCSMRTASGSNPTIMLNKSVAVLSGDSVAGSDIFKLRVYPNDKLGTALYRYDFFDTNDPSIKSSVFVEFSLEDLVGVEENQLSQYDFTIFPNPADEFLKFTVSERIQQKKTRTIIQDLLGKTVIDQQLNTISNKNQIDISTLTPGVYFVSFSLDQNNRITKKLIVK